MLYSVYHLLIILFILFLGYRLSESVGLNEWLDRSLGYDKQYALVGVSVVEDVVV